MRYSAVACSVLGVTLLAGLVNPVRAVPPLPTATASKTTAVTTAKPKPLRLKVYFMKNDKLAVAGRMVPSTRAVGRAAMLQLLSGPSAKEAALGMTSCIPDKTRLLGLALAKGTATVDLSKPFESGGGSLSMTARLAQVVYTLSQFPTVSRVVFWLDGHRATVFGGEGIVLEHPVTRASFEYVTPAILVEAPTPAEYVSSPVRFSGTANVFEGQFWAELTTSSGRVLVRRPIHATSGTGTRGTFSALLPYSNAKNRDGFLVTYDLSMKDGHREHVVRLPLKLSKS